MTSEPSSSANPTDSHAPRSSLQESVLVQCVSVDTSLYTDSAVFRACYAFTDRCYLFLRRNGPNEILVEFRSRNDATSLSEVIGAFSNELIDQRIRGELALETRRIREWVVAQAFIEADLPGAHPLAHLTPSADSESEGAARISA